MPNFEKFAMCVIIYNVLLFVIGNFDNSIEIYEENKIMKKYDEAVGLFWGAALFIGAFVCVIIGFNGNMSSDWIKAGLAGVCVFLSTGLISQGIIALIKKDKE